MNFSYFLGAFLGLYLIIMGVALLTRKEMFQKLIEDFSRNPALIFFSGIMSLLIGLLIILTHNAWVMSWIVMITILGYLFFIQGLIRIYFPDWVAETSKKFSHSNVMY